MSKKQCSFVSKVLIAFLALCYFAVPIGVVSAQSLKLKVDGTEKSGASLKEALTGVDLSQVRSLVITNGDVKKADWEWLFESRATMKSLDEFIVAASINSVADVETGVGKMKKELDAETNVEIEVPKEDGGPISSTCRYVEIHKLKKIAKNSFAEVGALEIAIFPDLEEIGAYGLAKHKLLRVLITPKMKKFEVNSLSDCSSLTMLRLSENPPTLEKKKVKEYVEVEIDDPQKPGKKIKKSEARWVEEKYPSVFSDVENANVPILHLVKENGAALSADELKAAKKKYFDVVDGRPNGQSWTGTPPTDTKSPEYAEYLATQPDELWFSWQISSFSKIEIDPNIQNGKISTRPWMYQKAGWFVYVLSKAGKGKGLDKLSYTVPGSSAPATEVEESFKMPETDILLTATFKDKLLKGTVTVRYKTNEAEGIRDYSRDNAGSIEELFSKPDGSLLDELKTDGGLDLSNVIKIKITGGTFDKSDWGWLKINKQLFNHLRSFVIEKTVENVDPIKDNTDYEGIFFRGDYGSLDTVILHKVTAIGKFSFIACTRLRKVEAPDCTSLGANAFDSNSALVDFQAPKVTKIGKECFSACTRIKKLSFPLLESLVDPAPSTTDPIGLVSYAFLDCVSLESIDLGKVKHLPKQTFNSCLSLTEVKAPLVEIIGDCAFADEDPTSSDPKCISLIELSFPNLKRIGARAFDGCSALSQFTVGVEPPTVAKDAFVNCDAQNVLLFAKPDGSVLLSPAELAPVAAKFKAVKDGNDQDMKWYGWNIQTEQLYTVKMDNSVTNGMLTFEPKYAAAGKTITVTVLPALGYVPGTATLVEGTKETPIENGTFVMPAANVTVKAAFAKNNLTVAVNDGAPVACSSMKEAVDKNYADNYSQVKSLRVTGGVFTNNEWEWLTANAMSLIRLENFTIDEGVTVVDIPDVKNQKTFQGYFNQKSIATLNIAGLKHVGSLVFSDTKENLVEVNMPDLVTVGGDAFQGCEKLVKLNIPNVETIEKRGFSNTFSLSSVSLPKVKRIGSDAFNSAQIGAVGQSTRYGVLKEVEMPLVEELGESAFNSCKLIETLDVPNLRDIGKSCFAYCLLLNNIHFDNLDSIPGAAFYSCNRLSNFTFNNVKRLGNSAFAFCLMEEVKDEMFPSVTELGADAFRENIRMTTPITGLTSITLSKVTKIGAGALRRNFALTYANFQSLKDLGAAAFKYDNVLKTVIAPNLETIGKEAFRGCTSLTTLAIGAKVPKLLAESEEDKLKTFECDGCVGRRLILLADDGLTPLSGDALKLAVANYKNDAGWGKVKKDTWYGWTITTSGVYASSVSEKTLNGTIEGLPSFFPKGAEVTLNARPNKNYQEKEGTLKAYKKGDETAVIPFMKDAAGNTIKKIQMPDHDVEVYVEFQKKPFEIKVEQLFDGKITCQDITDLKSIPWDTKVTLVITPDKGKEYQAGTLKVTNENGKIEIPVDENYSFTMPQFNVKVTAKFQDESPKDIEIAEVEHGQIFAKPARALSGVQVNLTILPETGYKLADGSLKVYKKGDPATTVEVKNESFIMPNFPVEVSATFEKASAVEDALLALGVKAYPNPFADAIEINDASAVVAYRLYNVAGVACLAGVNAEAATTLRIDTKALADGLYLLQLDVKVVGQERTLSVKLKKSSDWGR